MKDAHPALCTKIGCPWCAEAREILQSQGIAYTNRPSNLDFSARRHGDKRQPYSPKAMGDWYYDEQSVTTDAAVSAEMLRVSGQMKALVLDGSGEILADFGAAELESFLAARVLEEAVAREGYVGFAFELFEHGSELIGKSGTQETNFKRGAFS